MENSADSVLLDQRTAGSQLGNAEDIQNTPGHWDVRQSLEVLLRSDKQAEESGSHSRKALLLLWGEEPWEQGLQTEPGRGWG